MYRRRLNWLIFTGRQELAEGMVCPGFPAGRGTGRRENLEQILGPTAGLSVQESHLRLLKNKMKGSRNCNPSVRSRPQSLEYSPSIQFETWADQVPGGRSLLIIYQASLRKKFFFTLSYILHLITLSFIRGFMTRKETVLCRKMIFTAAKYIPARNEKCCSA